MAYILTLLRNFWASLISYLQAGKRELKPGENQLEKQVTECEQAKKQLQQTSNLLASLLLQVVTEYRQIETQLKNAIGETESLKQTVQELQQKSATLERERDEARETLTKLHLENTLLEQKVEQVEALKDVLTRESNQASADNSRLTQDNLQLQISRNSLETELKQTIEQINNLEIAKDKLEQEKAKLERELIEVKQEKSKITSLEQLTNNSTPTKNEGSSEFETLNNKNNQVPDKSYTTENESLKQTVRELQQQSATLKSNFDKTREASAKLHHENTLLDQKIKQLESHKKVLIQELSVSLRGQDIELITWDFLIHKVKEVTTQLNEVIPHNQSLVKTNRDLQQERDLLRRELNQVKDSNTRLTQDNLQLRDSKNSLETELRRTLDRIKPLERAKDNLEQEKAQLERKISELNKVESKLRQAEAEIEQLEEEVEELEQTKNRLEVELKQEKAKVTSFEQKIKDLEIVKNQLEMELKQEKSKIVPLEQKIKGLEQAKNQSDAELKQEKAKVAPLEQKNKNLEQVRNQLEAALKQERSRVAVLERESSGLSIDKNEGGSESRNTADKNEGLLRKISELNQTIKQLEEKINRLECKPGLDSSEQEQKASNRYYTQPGTYDEIDLLEQYNNLVYFVQESLNCSDIEELEDWGETEEFYVELISRLCFIDTILVTKVESLESKFYFIPHKDNYQNSAISLSYPGKFLFWSNGEVRWELSSFFNSKL